jgi:hypothetical protein
METAAIFVAIALTAFALLTPRVRRSTAWRATVTPLASIIGSGFLVLAPLLAATAGEWAPLAMVGIVGVAYAIGATIRFNIAHADARLDSGDAPRILVGLERGSRLLLGLAYMISVAFYLRLLASFLLDAAGLESALGGRALTTAALATIAAVGWFRGLHGIEAFEIPAVDVKLIVIAALLGALAVYSTTHHGVALEAFSRFPVRGDGLTLMRKLAGMLLVVQGFETSRYLGRYYEPALRVRTMRSAQLISGAIYVAFAILIVPLFGHLGTDSRETAIIDAARYVTPVLVPMLFIAAIASQLSAAAADTAGGSEMITERGRHERGNLGYVIVAGGACVVVWATDVFGIISLASRAFAAYYLCQALIAARVATLGDRPNRRLVTVANLALAVLLLAVTILAMPGE